MLVRCGVWCRPGVRWCLGLGLLLALVHTGRPNPPGRATDEPFRPDRILVRPKPGQGPAALASLHGRTGAFVLRRFPSLGNLQVVQLPQGLSVATALAAYRGSSRVEFAEPDYWVQASMEPNDPAYTQGFLWGLHNTGQLAGTSGIDIAAPAGWDIRSAATNVLVAIIDSGINYRHPDLAPNLWMNPAPNAIPIASAVPFVNDLHGINAITQSGDPDDDFGHGSLLAGIIGARGNNSQGTVGVAWQVQLMACKFLDSQGTGSISDAITSIDYARLKGARILNASWNDANYSEALRSAILRARQDGIIVVASAGNGGQDNDQHPSYPCGFDLDNIVAVTAITPAGRLSANANYGAKTVHLAAPGENIYSTWLGLSPYATGNGTSMATAYVSGVFALVRAQFPDEGYPQAIQRVLRSVKPLAALQGKCQTGGLVNLQQALAPGVMTRLQAAPQSGVAPLSVQFSNLTAGVIASQTWDFGDGSALATEANPSHVFTNAGQFLVSLVVTGVDGFTSSNRLEITVLPNYEISPGSFSWIEPDFMRYVQFDDSGVSPPQPLPFSFLFYGKLYDRAYIGRNGIMGFARAGLETIPNQWLPNDAVPHAMLCPYWDKLDLGTAGNVRVGAIGLPPARKWVVSWVGVNRADDPATTLSFQVVLDEPTQGITFQYLEVQPGQPDGGAQDATVGVEAADGSSAVLYTFDGSPATLTNGQALVLLPNIPGGLLILPTGNLTANGKTGGPFTLDRPGLVLKNIGSAVLHWAADTSQDWLVLARTQGTLAPGESTTVSVNIGPAAAKFIPGQYVGQVRLLDFDNGAANTVRQITLNIHIPRPAQLVPLRSPSATRFQWRFTGEPGLPLRWETSIDLVHWDLFQTNSVPPEGILDMSADWSSGPGARFYRAAPQP